MAYKTLTIASDNGVEIQRISKSLGPYKDTPRYRIVVSRVCRDSSRGKDVRKKKRKGGKERKRTRWEKRRRLKYFRGSRRRAIIEKGFHFASVLLADKKCESFEFPSEIYPPLIGHSYFLRFAPCDAPSLEERKICSKTTEAKNYEFTRRSRRRLRRAE